MAKQLPYHLPWIRLADSSHLPSILATMPRVSSHRERVSQLFGHTYVGGAGALDINRGVIGPRLLLRSARGGMREAYPSGGKAERASSIDPSFCLLGLTLLRS